MHLVRSSQSYMECEGSLPCTEEITSGSYPEPTESSPHPHTDFFDPFWCHAVVSVLFSLLIFSFECFQISSVCLSPMHAAWARIAQLVQWLAMGWITEVWVLSSGRGKVSLLYTSSRKVLGPTQSPNAMDTWGLFFRGKAAGVWSWPLTSN
jgi:hypothetical protein